MLTGVPTAFGLHVARVETLRFEARYTGAHTDDIYCQLRDNEGSRLQLIQCKRGLDATPGNTEFVRASKQFESARTPLERPPLSPSGSCVLSRFLPIRSVSPRCRSPRAAASFFRFPRICLDHRASSAYIPMSMLIT